MNLDTDVLSEILRPSPNPAVLAWLTEQPSASLFTTAVSAGEILYGISTFGAAALQGSRLLNESTLVLCESASSPRPQNVLGLSDKVG